jgi:arginyl-tRNA synthetase
MRALADFPEEVEQAAHGRGAHRMTRYGQDLARIFHSFYTNCRVLGDDPALTAARLALVEASRIVLRNICEILGIDAPERM